MITHYINLATPDQLVAGTLWYDVANQFCERLAVKYGYTVNQVAGIVAATSVNTSWDDNKRRAECYLKTGTCGHFGFVLEKCEAILKTDSKAAILVILRGQKIQNFFLNLLGDENAVTIDRWAMRVLGRSQKPVNNVYKKAAAEYRRAATRLSNKYGVTVTPAKIQAITWEVIRSL